MTNALSPTAAQPRNAKATDNEVQAAARIWLAAKVIEATAKAAKDDRKQAESVLDANLTTGDTVTLDGNRRLTFKRIDASRASEGKILKALRILHPDVAATIDRLAADAEYRTNYSRYDLK